MHGNKIIGALFAIAAAGLMWLTTYIIDISGAMQGVTAEGRAALGYAAIGVHVVGVGVVGLAVGALWGRQWLGAAFFALVMLGCAAVSVYYISGFALSEVMSVTKAREAGEKAAAAQQAAAIAAAKQGRDVQAKLAEQQLKIIEGEAKRARGRSSRKDAMEAGNKLVADVVGGSTVVVTATPETAPKAAPERRSDMLPETIATLIGWKQSAVQLSTMLYVAMALIFLEMIAWPAAAYFWRKPAFADRVLEAYAAAPQRAVEADPPRAGTFAPPDAQKALPAPQAAVVPQAEDVGQPDPDPPTPARVHPARVQAPTRVERRPLAGSEASLAGIGFPLTRPNGPLRGKDKPRDAARRFVVWLRAMGLHGSHSATELAELYREFAGADHREPIAYNHLAAVLEKEPAVSRVNATVEDGKRALRWVVASARFKAAEPEPDAAPEPVRERLGHLTPSKQAEHIADAAPAEGRVIRRPFGVGPGPVLVAAMRLDRGEPAWLHENIKAMRRVRLVANAKQRVGRAGRKVA